MKFLIENLSSFSFYLHVMEKSPVITEVTKHMHKRAVQARKDAQARFRTAYDASRNGTLTEARKTQHQSAVIAEAIIYERAALLEAFGTDAVASADAQRAMLSQLDRLAARLGSPALETTNARLQASNPGDGVGMAGDGSKWSGFQRHLADASVVTKGLLALADAVDDTSSEIGSLLQSLQSVNGYQMNEPLGHALAGLSPEGGRRGGMLSRLLGGNKTPNARFADACTKALSTASGISRHLNVREFCEDLMNLPVGRLLGALRNYGTAVAESVPPAVLTSMTKQSLMGTIKSTLGGIGASDSAGHMGRLGGPR